MMKRLKKRLFLLIALIALFPVICASAANQAVLNAAGGVVRVYAQSAYSNTANVGSGFAVGKTGHPVEYIITNYHVIKDENDLEDGVSDNIFVILDNIKESDGILRAEVVRYDKDADYCILKIEPTAERTPLVLKSAVSVERTQEVFALGFPNVADDINDDGDNLPSTVEDVTITKGVVSKTNSKINNAYFLQMDTVINSGNSGGPLVTEEGHCVGINTFGALSGYNTNCAIYIDYAAQALIDLNIPFEMAGGGALITSSEKAGGLFFAVIAAFVLCGALITFLVVKKAAHREKTQETKGSGEPSKRFIIVGVTGVYSGSIFPARSEIVLGRDVGACNIVYPDKTPGISNIHCRLIPDADCLIIEDMGSSYGTYLSDKKRIAPGEREQLREGAGFYLASQENSFIVKMDE